MQEQEFFVQVPRSSTVSHQFFYQISTSIHFHRSHDQVTKYQQEVPLHTHHKDLYVLAFLGREAAVLIYVRPFVQIFIIKWLGALEREDEIYLLTSAS
jgi:positive regulator of sigma E activity